MTESQVERAAAMRAEIDALVAAGIAPAVGDGLVQRGSATHNPINGVANPIAPPAVLRLVGGPAGKHAVGEVTFGAAYAGKPGYVHGGWIAAVFDQLLGYAKLVPALTADLSVQFRRPIPIGAQIRLEAHLMEVDGRRRTTRGTMHVGDELVAEASALFVVPRDAGEPDEYPITEVP